MKPNDPDTVEDTEGTASDETPALESYPAGKNHDDLLLCGPENDTQWLMSDTFEDLEGWR